MVSARGRRAGIRSANTALARRRRIAGRRTPGRRQPVKHRQFQACGDPFGPLDEHGGERRFASLRNRLPKKAEPDIEILRTHLFQLHVRRYGAAVIGTVAQDHRTPEIRHLFQMRLPGMADLAGKDRPQARIGANPAVKVAHQPADKGAVDACGNSKLARRSRADAQRKMIGHRRS
ncbi:MAG: hypothetical protein RLN95_10705 [Nitratireductor sp.]